ncbi:glycine cleavage system protein R [Microbulbifer magnicolonia]|uniref:glycine cleavage system protein R n=1 Tax=Microbulbifer magnicolonia TaxID=3109744 RepID=UPI002B415A3F|nr:ACT domain-containing protein [Microbulbifer sp. GG15]
MQQHLVISLISDDKPGVVEKLSAVVAENGGNWEDSRMAHFAGKFAGILRVSVPSDSCQGLKDALAALAGKGYKLVVEEALAVATGKQQTVTLKLVGNDRPGIVREISRALAARQINMEQLETGYSSTPWSGEPLFTAECTISVAEDMDLDGLRDELDEIADELGVEIDCETATPAV